MLTSEKEYMSLIVFLVVVGVSYTTSLHHACPISAAIHCTNSGISSYIVEISPINNISHLALFQYGSFQAWQGSKFDFCFQNVSGRKCSLESTTTVHHQFVFWSKQAIAGCYFTSHLMCSSCGLLLEELTGLHLPSHPGHKLPRLPLQGSHRLQGGRGQQVEGQDTK